MSTAKSGLADSPFFKQPNPSRIGADRDNDGVAAEQSASPAGDTVIPPVRSNDRDGQTTGAAHAAEAVNRPEPPEPPERSNDRDPKQKRIVRRSFDVWLSQFDALRRLKAWREYNGDRKVSQSSLVRQALDEFLARQTMP